MHLGTPSIGVLFFASDFTDIFDNSGIDGGVKLSATPLVCRLNNCSK